MAGRKAGDDLDATRIRELLLDFYAENDPQRLNMGLDIFSMVVWTQQNGLASLNDLLMEQYGAKIDPNKQLGGAQASFKRFSALMNTDSDDDAQRRNHIYTKLVEFYEQRDPSKIGRLNDFVQYIMLHGIDAFNRKLVAKYGEGISVDADAGRGITSSRMDSRQSLGSSFTISTVTSQSTTSYKTANSGSSSDSARSATKPRAVPAPPPKKRADKLPQDDEEVEDLSDLPPPPPPIDEVRTSKPPSPTKLKAKLKGYYALHDPDKLTHVDAIVEWGMQIGEEELEGKLMQIYGVGFNPSNDAPPPAAAPARKNEQNVDAKRVSLRDRFRTRAGSKASNTSNAQKPSAPQQPMRSPSLAPSQLGGRAKPAKPKGSRNPLAMVQAQAGFSDSSNGRPNTMARIAASPDDGPCSYYELDMTGAGFGVCRCGYSRLAHMKGSPENRKATENAKKKAHKLTAEMRSTQFHPQSRASQLPSPIGVVPNSPTGSYLNKTTASSSPPLVRVDVRANGGEKGGDHPCGNFRLDMTAGSFSVCECGFKRDQHGKISGLRSSMKRLSKRVLGR